MEKAGVLRIDVAIEGEKRVMVLASSDVDVRLRKLKSDRKLGKLTVGFMEMAAGDDSRLIFSEVGRCAAGSEEGFAQATREELGAAGYIVWGVKRTLDVVVSEGKHSAWIAAGVKAIEAGMRVEELRDLIEKETKKDVKKVEIEVKSERCNGIQLSLL
jgi:hypothetical protein